MLVRRRALRSLRRALSIGSLPLHDLPEAHRLGLLRDGQLAYRSVHDDWRNRDLRAALVLPGVWVAAVLPVRRRRGSVPRDAGRGAEQYRADGRSLDRPPRALAA